MRRFLIVYTLAYVGALAGAALGTAVLAPTPPPGTRVCGLASLPGMLLGGALGAVLASLVGLR